MFNKKLMVQYKICAINFFTFVKTIGVYLMV